MTNTNHDPKAEGKSLGHPAYAASHLAKALTTAEQHENSATRERAEERVSKWKSVLRNVLTGTVAYGSRMPIGGIPVWATLEVVTGGFATGELLAGGPLQEHEHQLLGSLPNVPSGAERTALNAHYLTDAGLAELNQRLHSGHFDVAVPEEGALMVVAWLVENGDLDGARELVQQLAPFFPRLRFYPIALEQSRIVGAQVHLQCVGVTVAGLRKVKPNIQVLAHKEAVEVWLPLHDRIVALFLETVENSWPCQKYQDAWPERALAILREVDELRKVSRYCGKIGRAQEHSTQLRTFLGKCARNPEGLTGREVGRIRLILDCYVAKRCAPHTPTWAEARRRQAAAVSAPPFHAIAEIVAMRLESQPQDDGLDAIAPLIGPITATEASSGVPEGTTVPASIQRKVERSLKEGVGILIERGLITSGDTLARCLPQMTSDIRAVGITEPALHKLFAAIYRAFRRRRSLLLLNMQRQIQIEELPWVAAIERFRSDSQAGRMLARHTLQEVTVLTLTSFPQAILPNKLLQELRALVTSADLEIPLVDELATDIFMGKFSRKFVESTWKAADLLQGSLYASYYGIDYEHLRLLLKPKPKPKQPQNKSTIIISSEEFASLCAERAQVPLGTWHPATNGMIIEQQQILTTQNLAALYAGLGLADCLHGELSAMAKQCFEWVCKRQQVKENQWHAKLKTLKNTAYAWRQMVFFLALLPDSEVVGFLQWAEVHFYAQEYGFQQRFAPAFRGLCLVANGGSLDQPPTKQSNARRFLGWSDSTHWLLADR